jgi:TonB family protein
MKTSRFVTTAFVVLFTSISAFAVNDFWLGCRYTVGVTFKVQQEAYIDPPRLKAPLRMPSYPLDLLGAALEGKATVQYLIREDGTVADVSVLHADFDAFGLEAKKAVEGMEFTPGTDRRDGKHASVRMQCVFDFRANDLGPGSNTPLPAANSQANP